ncbi:MAG: hypothetical protein ABR999_02150 [Methanoregula sp.]|jgi:hypothetical protein|uniref:hypothetical protein n=1 Tax=Methanoregula sp. TaxID=2052170 RepID=UPI003D0EB9C0
MAKDLFSPSAAEDLYPDENVIYLITICTSEPMPSESRQIKFYIKPKDEKAKYVSITSLADFFQHLQLLLYQVCQEVEEREYKKTGRYPKAVIEHCDLVLKEITIASAGGAVELGDSQMGLPIPGGFEKTYGEQAIALTNDIFTVVREKDHIFPDLSPYVPDENRRKRVLSEVDKMWPEENSKYICEIATGSKHLKPMHPSRKPKIKQALETEIAPQDKIVYGRLIVVNYTKKHTCQIETSEGRYDCKYSPELVDLIKSNGNELVSITGKLTESKTILIKSESDLGRINKIPLDEIVIEETPKALKTSIDLSINFDKEDDTYTVENGDLNVFAISDDLKAAVESLKEQIGTIWVTFVKENPTNLTDSAITFRQFLIDLIGEEL